MGRLSLYPFPSAKGMHFTATTCMVWAVLAGISSPAAQEQGGAQLQMGVTVGAMAAVDVPVSAASAAEPGRSSSGRPATLAQLAALALTAQPAVLFADAQLRASSERLEQARGGLRPNLSGSLGHRREFADGGGSVSSRSTSGGLLLSIPVLRRQADASVGQAEFSENSSRFAVEEARQEILFRVLDAYLGATQADEELSLLQNERAVLLDQRRINERRMQGGVGTRVEVMETSARSESTLAQIESARSLYASQLAELSRLSASPVASVLRLRDQLPPMFVPLNVAEAVQLARRQSSAIARLESQLAAARAGIEVQRSAQTPTVDLVGNLDRTRFAFDAGSTFLPSTAVGVQVQIPLYTGGIVGARTREAQAQAEAAQAQLEDAVRVLETEMRKAYLDLQSVTGQWRIQVGVLATANAALEATRKAFDAGARSNIDLLNSQQLTFNTRRELARARAAVLAAQVRILSLGSGLNLPMLARLETAFDQAEATRREP